MVDVDGSDEGYGVVGFAQDDGTVQVGLGGTDGDSVSAGGGAAGSDMYSSSISKCS